LFEQTGHPKLAAGLARVTHVQRDFAAAVNATALQSGLLEQSQQTLIVPGFSQCCRTAFVTSTIEGWLQVCLIYLFWLQKVKIPCDGCAFAKFAYRDQAANLTTGAE
jgi:hypothetical protein